MEEQKINVSYFSPSLNEPFIRSSVSVFATMATVITVMSINGCQLPIMPQANMNEIRIEGTMPSLNNSIVVYNSFISDKEIAAMDIDARPSQSDNMDTLDSFSMLHEDLNDDSMVPISENLIKHAKGIIMLLTVQPEIFPTARGSVQFEYDRDNGDYLEFEIFDDQRVAMLFMGADGNNIGREFALDGTKLNEVVNSFYGDGVQ